MVESRLPNDMSLKGQAVGSGRRLVSTGKNLPSNTILKPPNSPTNMGRGNLEQ